MATAEGIEKRAAPRHRVLKHGVLAFDGGGGGNYGGRRGGY